MADGIRQKVKRLLYNRWNYFIYTRFHRRGPGSTIRVGTGLGICTNPLESLGGGWIVRQKLKALELDTHTRGGFFSLRIISPEAWKWGRAPRPFYEILATPLIRILNWKFSYAVSYFSPKFVQKNTRLDRTVNIKHRRLSASESFRISKTNS